MHLTERQLNHWCTQPWSLGRRRAHGDHSCGACSRLVNQSGTSANLVQHKGQLLYKIGLPLLHSQQPIRQLSPLMPAGEAKGR